MQEQDNSGIGDLSRRGVLMGAATGGLLIAGSGAMLAPLLMLQQQSSKRVASYALA